MEFFLNLFSKLKKHNFLAFGILFLAVYLYIFGVLLNYQHAWMNQETAIITDQIYRETSLSGHLGKSLDWFTMEGGSPYGRPASRARFFSHIFFVVNSLFRQWLFHFIPPHPSLSLTWLIALFLSPYFLHRLVLNLFDDKKVALITSLVYVCLPGCLIPIMMLFRPDKTISNFFYIFCLYLASGIYRNVSAGVDKNFKRDFSILALTVFCSFLFDEYSLFIFFLIPILFPALFKKPSPSFAWAVYLYIPILYGLTLFYFLPTFYALVGHPGFNFFGYVNLSLPPAFSLFNNVINFFLLLHENLLAGFTAYLKNNEISVLVSQFDYLSNRLVPADNIRLGLSFFNNPNISLWQILHNILVLIAFVGVIYFLAKPKVSSDSPSPPLKAYFFKISIALIAYSAFFSLLHIKSNILAGCGWYGSSFSVIFCLLLAVILKMLSQIPRAGKYLAVLLACSLMINSLWNVKLLNNAWRVIAHNPNYWQLDMWLNKTPREELYKKHFPSKETASFEFAHRVWQKRAHSGEVLQTLAGTPKEIQTYLIVELLYRKVRW